MKDLLRIADLRAGDLDRLLRIAADAKRLPRGVMQLLSGDTEIGRAHV